MIASPMRTTSISCWRGRLLLFVAPAILCATAACQFGPSSTSPDRAYRYSNEKARRPVARPKVQVEMVDDPVLGESSTLEDYLAYAALNNAGLEGAFNRWRAALERVPQVRSLADPKLTYRYFIREVETRVGPQKQGVGLSQTFPWFGKLELRGDAAAEAANAERQKYESTKLSLFYEVKDAFNEYYYLRRAIEVVQENLDLLEYLESVARARYETAAGSHPDVIRAQVELGKLENQREALHDLRGPVVARLNGALNRPAEEELPFPNNVWDDQLAGADTSILDMLPQYNPELLALDHFIEKAQYEIELARKEYYPDITFGVDYTDVGQPPSPTASPAFASPLALRGASNIAGGNGSLLDLYTIDYSRRLADRPADAGQDIWMVYFSLNIPIWHDKYAAGEREARAQRLAAKSERRQREHDLATRVKRALYEYRDAERKILLYRDTLIPKAKESIASTETAFRVGTATFLELVDAERSLLEFQLSYERALSNRASRVAELDSLVGTSLPRAPRTSLRDGTAKP